MRGTLDRKERTGARPRHHLHRRLGDGMISYDIITTFCLCSCVVNRKTLLVGL
jgi:hypothetical protein